MSKNSRAINITLPSDLLEKLDKAAKSEYASRSDYIRESIVRRLKGQRIVDEWGDEGNWETVVDFRALPRGGIELDDLISRLGKIDGQDK